MVRKIIFPYKHGDKINRLTFLYPLDFKKPCGKWKLRCDCGKEVVSITRNVRSGNTKSCGCYNRELISKNIKTHGMSKTTEYYSWSSAKNRCANKNSTDYPDYGGRGISVCGRWIASFENFYADMGKKPKGYSLDRIDNNGNYDPSNCRWASNHMQAANRRTVVLVDFLGKKMPCIYAERRLGLKGATISAKVSRTGMTHQQALDYFVDRQSKRDKICLDQNLSKINWIILGALGISA